VPGTGKKKERIYLAQVKRVPGPGKKKERIYLAQVTLPNAGQASSRPEAFYFFFPKLGNQLI